MPTGGVLVLGLLAVGTVALVVLARRPPAAPTGPTGPQLFQIAGGPIIF